MHEWQIEVRDSLAEVPASTWNALALQDNPFLQHEFLYGLEATGCVGGQTGWYPRYFLLWADSPENTRLLGAVATFLKTHSYGEFVFDWAWAEAFERHSLPYYPKLVAAVPFTPATGPRLLYASDVPEQPGRELSAAESSAAWPTVAGPSGAGSTRPPGSRVTPARIQQALLQGISQFTDSEELSGAHLLFVPEDEHVLACDADTGAGWLSRIDCQYHWHNRSYTRFDDFLTQCTSKRRKTIRRERRYVSDAGLRLERLTGDELSREQWGYVHNFYCTTFDRKWGNPSLTREFFERMGATFGARTLIVFAYDPGDAQPERPVACSVMFRSEKALYGRYWGCRRDYHSLHFEACYYQGIEHCIAEGIELFEPGAQGEHKITRGFEPTLTCSAHYIAHPGFRDAIANYLEQEREHVEQRCAGLTDLLPFKVD